MNTSVEVCTVDEDTDSRQTEPLHHKLEAVSGAAAPPADEPLVEAMKSLREQLDRLESSYDVKRINTNSASRAASHARDIQSGSLFSSGGDTGTFSAVSNVNGNTSGPIRPDTSVLGEEATRSTRLSSVLTPSRRMSSSSTVNRISSPVRYEPSIITEDPSLRSERPSIRTPPRPTTSSRPVHVMGDTSTDDYLSLSATKPRSRTTPSRPIHSPPPPVLGTPAATPFSAQKATNQSFVSYLGPEPVQTPNPSVLGGARGLSEPPELRLLDSLLGTVEALRKRMDEHEVRLEQVERTNTNLQEEVRYWRTEASRWQYESQRDRERREEERREFRRPQDNVPEVHHDDDRLNWQREESRPSWQRDEGHRESPRDERRREWQRDESRRSADRPGHRESPAHRANATSPGGLFVEDLSERLPLNADQYEVLVELMNRYFVEGNITDGQGR